MVKVSDNRSARKAAELYEFPRLAGQDLRGGATKVRTGPEGAENGQATDIAKDAESRSFDKAYRDNFADILASRREVVAKAGTAVERQLAAWENLDKRLERKVSRSIVKGALELAGIMIARALEAEPELVRNVVSMALAMVVTRTDMVVRSHPEDWQMVKEMIDSLETEHGNLGQVRVESDSGIDRGGCVIETEFGMIDARIDSQLNVIRRALES